MVDWGLAAGIARRLCQYAVVIGTILLCSPWAHATTVRQVELGEHVELSDMVVLASVAKKHSFVADDGVIYTDTTLEVLEVLAGPPQAATLVVRQMGGQVGDAVQFVPGDARLERDTRVVVFLADREPATDVVYLTALAQSEYIVVGTLANGDLALTRDFNGLTFYAPGAVAPLAGRAPENLSLDTLRTALHALASERGR